MERQENDENNADIKAKIELETDIEERMPSYSGNKDNDTVKLESDIYFKEEQPNYYYVESNIMEFEEAGALIKLERTDSVKLDSEDQEEDIGVMKEVKVSLTKFDKFTCVVCDRNLDRRVPMGAYKHYNEIVLFCKVCIKPNGKKFMCVKCSRGFSTRFHLIDHVDGLHRKLKKYKCEECNSAFTQMTNLKVHVQSVHLKLKHPCQQCKKVFSNRTHLHEHVNFTHRQLNIFTCDLCNKEFPNQYKFKRHIDAFHRKIKKFECNECKHAFFTVHNLTRHVKSVHLKIKYTCATCNKAFTQKGSLIKHIDLIHRKIRQFVCAICNHAFGKKCNIKKHITSAKCQSKNINQ